MPRRPFTDLVGASSIFRGSMADNADTPVSRAAPCPCPCPYLILLSPALGQIFQSEINPDPFSPSASRRDDHSLPRLAGSPAASEVDPYRLSSASDSERDGQERSRDAREGRQTGAGRTGAGWWVHQSVLPSAAASRTSRRPRRRPQRDLDDVYPSDEEASDSGTSSGKPSDPPSPRPSPPRHHPRSPSVTDTQTDTESDYSSSGSSFASTSTASALSRSSHDSHTMGPHRSRSRREPRMRDPPEDDDDHAADLEPAPVVVPQRLEVYQDTFGHWKGRGARSRYKGERDESLPRVLLIPRSADSPFLALWLASLMGIMIALCFVWGSTTVSRHEICVSSEY